MDLILRILTVVALGAGGIMQAVAAGTILELDPLVTTLAVSVGGVIGIIIVTLAGERLRRFFLRWIGGNDRFQSHWSYKKIWLPYGVPGLGLFGPILINPPVTAALGVALGAPRGRFLIWSAFGVVFGSALMAYSVAAGWAGLQEILKP
jgi:hypothetical protein